MPAPVTTKKNKAQSAKVKKTLSADDKRAMEYHAKKFKKDFKPASGRVDFTVDDVAPAILMGRGFGVRSAEGMKQTSFRGKGTNVPDLEQQAKDKFKGMNAKRKPPMGPVRKAK
jgi:hypothetical protein